MEECSLDLIFSSKLGTGRLVSGSGEEGLFFPAP